MKMMSKKEMAKKMASMSPAQKAMHKKQMAQKRKKK